MDEDMVAKMLDHRSSDLDERTKAALDLTEDFVMNHAHGIDDGFMKRLREHFSEEQVVELAVAIGIWDSIHKFNNVFDVDPPVSEGQFTVEPPDATLINPQKSIRRREECRRMICLHWLRSDEDTRKRQFRFSCAFQRGPGMACRR